MPNTIIADWLNLPSVKFHEAIIVSWKITARCHCEGQSPEAISRVRMGLLRVSHFSD
jgi:hypothetical protein